MFAPVTTVVAADGCGPRRRCDVLDTSSRDSTVYRPLRGRNSRIGFETIHSACRVVPPPTIRPTSVVSTDEPCLQVSSVHSFPVTRDTTRLDSFLFSTKNKYITDYLCFFEPEHGYVLERTPGGRDIAGLSNLYGSERGRRADATDRPRAGPGHGFGGQTYRCITA